MSKSNIAQRCVSVAAAILLMLGFTLSAAADRFTQVAYYTAIGDGESGGLLIDWQANLRARVVNEYGAQSGAVKVDPSQRIISLDAPLSKTGYFVDSPTGCGDGPLQRKDTNQIVVRDLRSRDSRQASQVIEIGTVTILEGCEAGLVLPFGASTDAGTTLFRVAAKDRPSVRDLVPGTQIAGFSEMAWDPDGDRFLSADVLTLYAGGMALFASTGHVVPAAFDDNKWLVFNFGGFQRAYARLAVDDETGAERWLRAEWADGQAQRVLDELMVKPNLRAGFGTERQASRMWESGLFTDSPSPFSIYLYQGGTGERVTIDAASGAESRRPITWMIAGKNVLQSYSVGDARRDRVWVPLRNSGSSVHFVLESEIMVLEDGTAVPQILPRVNFYTDRGKATVSQAIPAAALRQPVAAEYASRPGRPMK